MLRKYLPYALQRELFGDRRRWGTIPDEHDADWQRWLEAGPAIYQDTQRTSRLAMRVNDSGYDVLDDIDLQGLAVAEIGPGGAYHLDRFRGRPAVYDLVDVEERFLQTAREKASARGLPVRCHLAQSRSPTLPFPKQSHDVVLSFYSLEHLAPLQAWVGEIGRVLKPGGRLVGAIPAEGGLAWGAGRWLTSRPLMRDKYGLDVRKIICWEHVNFCDDILRELGKLGAVSFDKWPLSFLPSDLSLVIRFVVTTAGAS